MKPDDSLTVYVLYGCTLSKERSSMRIVSATTDEEMLHTIIGAQILGGTMDYRGFSNMKGFEQFRAACRAGDVRYSDLDYGFVEQTKNLMLTDCAKEPRLEKAYRLLNLSEREFNAIRSGSLENLGADRTCLILDKALSWAAQNYAGWDLYRHLRRFPTLGLNWMSSTRTKRTMRRRMIMRKIVMKNYNTQSGRR